MQELIQKDASTALIAFIRWHLERDLRFTNGFLCCAYSVSSDSTSYIKIVFLLVLVQSALSAANSSVWKILQRTAETPPTVAAWILWSPCCAADMHWTQLWNHQIDNCGHWSHVWEQAWSLQYSKYFVPHFILYILYNTEDLLLNTIWYVRFTD